MPLSKAIFALTFVALFVSPALTSLAQGPDPADYERGIVPNRSYSGSLIDKVDPLNGSLSLMIPIYSLPQKGKEKLEFDLRFDSTIWSDRHECEDNPDDPDGNNQQWCTDYIETYLPLGPYLVMPPAMNLNGGWSPFTYSVNSPAGFWTSDVQTTWTLSLASGESHAMTYKYPDTTYLFALDGSGYQAHSQAGNALVTAPDGTQQLIGYSADDIADPPILMGTTTDIDGNSITESNTIVGSYEIPSWQDTLNHTVSFSTQTIADISQCPVITATNQPLTEAINWIVPGPNGGTLTYLFCYADVTYRTNYFDTPTPSNQTQAGITNEAVGGNLALQSVVLPDKTYWGFVYESVSPNGNDHGYASITQLIYPSGAKVNYAWTQIYSCALSSLLPNTAVQQRTVMDAAGNSFPWSYQYNDPVTAQFDGQNLGTVITDPNGNDTHHSYSILASNPCYPTETDVSTYSGSYSVEAQPVRRVTTTYQHGPSILEGSGIFSPTQRGPAAALPSTISTTIDGVTAIEKKEYNSFVSVMFPQCVEKGQAFAINCGGEGAIPIAIGDVTRDAVTDGAGNVLKDVRTTYLQDDSFLGTQYRLLNLLGLPEVVTTLDGTGNPVAKTTYGYDNSMYLDGFSDRRGHLTTTTAWNNSGSDVTAAQTWLPSGQIEYLIDGSGNNAKHFTYGTNNNSSLYPTDVYDALGHHDQYAYDSVTAAITSHTDANLQTTIYKYDDAERLWGIHRPDAGTSATSLSTLYCYPSPTSIETVQATNMPLSLPNSSNACALAGNSVSTISQGDGVGHIVRQVTGNGSYVDAKYDGLGNLLYKSNPYLSVNDPTYGWTSYTYDALGRPLLQCQADNGNGAGPCVAGNSYLQWIYGASQSSSYAGATSAYDELRNLTVRTVDVLGRIVNVGDAAGLQTNYSYDVLGNLTSVNQVGNGTTDAARNRSFTYDSLSRLVCASNPENSTGLCPTTATSGIPSGVTAYTYDANGNVRSKTDARSVTVTYNYDLLNRLLGKTYTNGASGTQSACYQYDSAATNGIGRLGSTWTQTGSCSSSLPSSGLHVWRSILSYDQVGRLKQEKQCTPGNCTASATNPYSLTYAYDLAGNVVHSEDGIGQVVWTPQFTDNTGQLTGVAATTTWPTALYPTQLLSVQKYSPGGEMYNWTLGISNSNIPALTGVRQDDQRLRPSLESVTGHD